jgi:phosphocarrier protein HPr
MIVKILQNCQNSVHFTHKRETINAKSILSILMLAARKNSQITITVEGEDQDVAYSTMSELQEAFKSGFGE